MIFIAGCNSNEEKKVTTKKEIVEARIEFLHSEFYTLAYMAMATRVRLFISNATESERKDFRDATKSIIIEEMAPDYREGVSEKKHNTNIVRLSEKMSKSYKRILKDKKFKIGRAQKLLNLYLKYLWVAGEIPPPPHCPFDRIVIHEIMARHCDFDEEIKEKLLAVKWTELDWIEDKNGELGYRSLVKYAKQCKGDKYPSLAEWELVEYNNQ